jgi:hypothetical protein
MTGKASWMLIAGETEKTPYRRIKSLRYVAVALLLLALLSNSYGQLSLGYSLLGFAITALIVWSFAELLTRSRE